MSDDDTDFAVAELRRYSRRAMGGRVVLGLLGVLQAALALPWLVGESPFWPIDAVDERHLTRDGAFGAVLAAAAIGVAWSVRLAWFALPLVVGAMVLQAAMGVIDHGAAHVSVAFEVVHVVGALIGIGIALLVRPRRRRYGDPGRLRVVRGGDGGA